MRVPGVRGFERARSSQAGDEGTTVVELDDRADNGAGGPQADGPRADGVWAGRPQADGVRAGGPQEELSPGN